MRITGGAAKGRRVGFKKSFSRRDVSDELRPTAAKVRKAIFDILGERIVGSGFLDLYAGTGAVGIEALSRGADRVTFVEDNAVRAGTVRKLVGQFGFSGRAVVVRDRAVHYVSSRTRASVRIRTPEPFDIIFVDPPYASGEIEVIMPLLDSERVLGPRGVILVEHLSKKVLPKAAGNLTALKTYRYGDTSLTLYVPGAAHSRAGEERSDADERSRHEDSNLSGDLRSCNERSS